MTMSKLSLTNLPSSTSVPRRIPQSTADPHSRSVRSMVLSTTRITRAQYVWFARFVRLVSTEADFAFTHRYDDYSSMGRQGGEGNRSCRSNCEKLPRSRCVILNSKQKRIVTSYFRRGKKGVFRGGVGWLMAGCLPYLICFLARGDTSDTTIRISDNFHTFFVSNNVSFKMRISECFSCDMSLAQHNLFLHY